MRKRKSSVLAFCPETDFIMKPGGRHEMFFGKTLKRSNGKNQKLEKSPPQQEFPFAPRAGW